MTDVKKGVQPHFLGGREVWGVVGVVSWVDKNAEEEVLKPLLSRAAWELVQELWGGWGGWEGWELIFGHIFVFFPVTVATRTITSLIGVMTLFLFLYGKPVVSCQRLFSMF